MKGGFMSDIKKMYRTIMADHFPDEMIIKFGDQTLIYKKRTWKIPDDKTGELIEKGLRYGENPEQEAALYETGQWEPSAWRLSVHSAG